MAYEAITDAEVQAGKPVVGPGGFGEKVKKNFDYLYGQIGSNGAAGLQNGSFEIDSDGDGVPDGWSLNLYPGGTGALEEGSPAHGSRAWKFTHPGGGGNGGGTLTSDYVPCSEIAIWSLEFMHWCDTEGMKNEVEALFYDKDKLYLGSQTIFTSTTSSTTPILYFRSISPPAGSRYFKLRLIGGKSDTSQGGSAWFDGVAVSPTGGSVAVPDFTIPEHSVNGASWVDAGSVQLDIRIRSSTTTLTFQAEVVGTGSPWNPIYSYMRFRLDTENGPVYSNEVSEGGTSWATKTIQIAFQSNRNPLTLTMQLKSSLSYGNATGRVTNPNMIVG